jgi:hypothetical protein
MATCTLPARCAASAASAIRRVPSFCVCAHRRADPPSGCPGRKCSSVKIPAPIRPLFTLELQWRHARFKSTSGHAMSPNCLSGRYAGKRVTPANWGSPQLFIDLIKRFQSFFIISKEGPLRIPAVVPLYRLCYGKCRHMPQGTSNLCHHPGGKPLSCPVPRPQKSP